MWSKLKYALSFGILIFVVSCINDGHKKIIVEDPDGYYREEYTVIDDSIKDGMYLKYFSNGKLSDSSYYRYDTLEGIRKIFSDKGYVEILETYKKGILDGPYLVYHPNGNIKIKQTFIKNELSDYSFRYYPNGVLLEKVKIENGIENGPFEEYHPNGKIHWKGYYEEGDTEQDTLYEFDLTGDLIRKLFCKRGVCNTIWTMKDGYIKSDNKIKINDSLIYQSID